jgi:hypothetical protein
MTSPADGRPIDLHDGESMHLADARGSVLRVNRGQLWITQHHDTRDIVLVPGESWTVERNGLTLVTALRDSSLALAGQAADTVDRRGRRLHWTERIGAWLARLDERVGRRWAPYV